MLVHLAIGTRPDLAFAVGQLSRFVAKPSAKHIGSIKRVLRYLAGTVNYGINYKRMGKMQSKIVLDGFCESDWANDPESRKSTTGFITQSYRISYISKEGFVPCFGNHLKGRLLSPITAKGLTLAGGAVSRMSRRQTVVALSTAEAMYISACEATMEEVAESNILQETNTTHRIAMALCSTKGNHQFGKVKSNVNPADVFTKALDKHRLQDDLKLIWS
ncbi:Copiatype Polyprotein [Phytophthora palmivora]|uniref:Copiatype Polyprotein n=1 Tax=Phytophthora palmivora TaxID=4796 RepID=A0A2P4X289_9STRA|nr:Copiatype Polyprotein [Phytophthora palmivora]